MTRQVKRGGKIWVRIFPDHPITSHGGEIPMGKGKGAVDYYMTPVRTGTVMFEMDGVTEADAREAMRLAAHKLPMKTKFVIRH
jgi:large subunit ribosomal protein L16